MVVESEGAYPPTRYVRLDTMTANVYEYSDYPSPGESITDSLQAIAGDAFYRNFWQRVECTGVDTLTILGVSTLVKRFRVYYVFGEEYILGYGFGRVQDVTYSEDPCYPLLNYFYNDLSYARIDGHEFGTFVGIDRLNDPVPSSFELQQNYPNPFNPSTIIKFQIPSTGHVTLRVFDLLGREVATLVNEEMMPGRYERTFDGSSFAGGMYFCRLQSNESSATRKLVLLR